MNTIINNHSARKKTLSYINYLKTIALFAVIAIHVLGDRYYYNLPQNGIWYTLLAFGTLVRFGVPIFIMCSGALYLNEEKEFPIRKALRFAIKYAVIFIVWTVIYITADWLIEKKPQNYFVYFYYNFSHFKYHLWYLPMLIFLCIITPALKLLTKKENKKIVEYLLIVFTIVIIIRSFSMYFKNFLPLEWMLNFMPVELIKYTMIYLTGWYLATFSFPKPFAKIILITGLCCYLLAPLVNCMSSYQIGQKTFYTADNFDIFNYAFSCAIFLLCKIMEDKLPHSKCISFIAGNTLYAYLIHVLLIMLIQTYLIPQWLLSSYWCFLVFLAEILIVGAVSLFLSMIIKKAMRLFTKQE